uniref:Uncharacterized protein n=1 Tax=Glossina pallidipes TaxID=7398 RepID=A0A1A9Z6B2_GLOPL
MKSNHSSTINPPTRIFNLNLSVLVKEHSISQTHSKTILALMGCSTIGKTATSMVMTWLLIVCMCIYVCTLTRRRDDYSSHKLVAKILPTITIAAVDAAATVTAAAGAAAAAAVVDAIIQVHYAN